MKKITKILLFCILVSVEFFIAFSNKSPQVNAINCTPNFTKQCISNIVYWFDSCGVLQSVYQNCNTTNQICQNAQCIGNTASLNQTNQNQLQAQELFISLFASKEKDALAWQKNIEVSSNDKINFLLVVKNTSKTPIENVSMQVNVPDFVKSVNNLKIDNLAFAGNIASGINLEIINPNESKIIFFTGSFKAQTGQISDVVSASINAPGNIEDSDYVTLNIENQIAAAAISESTTIKENSLIDNLNKNWYIWLTIVAILIIVFIIIFKRLSSKI